MIAAGLVVVALVATLICILSRGRLVVRLRREYLKEWRLLGAPSLMPWMRTPFDPLVLLRHEEARAHLPPELAGLARAYRWSVLLALLSVLTVLAVEHLL